MYNAIYLHCLNVKTGIIIFSFDSLLNTFPQCRSWNVILDLKKQTQTHQYLALFGVRVGGIVYLHSICHAGSFWKKTPHWTALPPALEKHLSIWARVCFCTIPISFVSVPSYRHHGATMSCSQCFCGLQCQPSGTTHLSIILIILRLCLSMLPLSPKTDCWDLWADSTA